ncbi:cytochrome P450 [Sistotremastrum niveocremeum HHB9708]|uniref:Cytochrome P450 n=1 Tax=Sistotremastrum niveocremeum HHB9708 TaxID=1314777 RepID=A0A164TYK7_9AGAM|nr:cytochrome P450 [Sistotremastrum niveocremeum HHB9708]
MVLFSDNRFNMSSFSSFSSSYWAPVLNSVSNPRRLPYPPGPRGIPILGNALQMPKKDHWLTFGKWAAEFGNLIHLKILNRHILVITSYEDAEYLLSVRGSIYSDRPKLRLFRDHANWDNFLIMLPYGSSFHLQRRMLNEYFNSSAIKRYTGLVTKNAQALASQMIFSPRKFPEFNRMFIVATIMMITYGHEVKREDDEWVRDAEIAARSTNNFAPAGSHPLDFFPILGALPYRIWGKTFVKHMEELRKGAYNLSTKPYLLIRDRVKEGIAPYSIASHLIEENSSSDGEVLNEKDISGACGIIYVAGADTTTASINTFILTMMLYPEIQRKAQAEIDALLQGERLPTLHDRDALPYLAAILKEVLRWRPVAPSGMPHATVEDDEYNGMFIPKGTMIITDIWLSLLTMCHNPSDFPNPMEFDPDRFIEEGGSIRRLRADFRDPEDIVFGFGRRICVGQHIATAQMWITMATLLTTFHISFPKDKDGKEIRPPGDHFVATSRHPKTALQSNFAPRSEAAVKLLEETVQSTEDWKM